METNIFDKDESYLKRFIKNQGKKFDFPNFKYLDAKFHPKFKDHVVVLSENKFPDDCNFTFGWDSAMGRVSDIQYSYETEFKEAIDQVKAKAKEKTIEEVKQPSIDETVDKDQTKLENSMNNNTMNKLIDNNNNSESYEGGEGEGSREEDEKEMDRILDEEKEKVETSELLIDEIEKEFGDDMSKKDEKQSKKSQSRPSTSAKNVINDDEKSVKNNKIFEDNLDEKEEQKSIFKSKTTNNPIENKATLAESNDDNKSIHANDAEEIKENDSKNQSKLNTNRTDEELIDNIIVEETKNENVTGQTNNDSPPSIPTENVEPPKEEKKLSPSEEFELLTNEQKQEVINNISETLIRKGKTSFMYLSMQKEFLQEGFEIPESIKLNIEDFTYSNDNYFYTYFKSKYKGFEYQPLFLKHQFQISLWRFDEYGASKVKDEYFTPQNERKTDPSFRGFELKNSIDNENILIQEKCNYSEDKMLICIMDSLTLKIQNEIVVDTVDPDFVLPENSYDWYDYDYDNLSSQFPTKRNFNRAICWNKGKYLMVYQTKPSKVPAYYFKIYDTTTKEVISTLQRVNELKLMIFQVKVISNEPECLHMTLFNYDKACIIKINVFNSTIDIINSHSCFKQKPSDFYINDTADTCYVLFGYYDYGRMNNKLYIFGVKESPEIDIYAAKGHKLIIPNYPISTFQNNCFISIYNNESNFYSASSAGKVFYKSAFIDNTQFFNSYSTKDISMTSTNAIVGICETNDGDYGLIMFQPKGTPILHTIKEMTMIEFTYPWIFTVKGCYEIIMYNVVEKLYYYHKLGAPIFSKCSTVFTAYGFEIRAVLNLGEYLAYCNLTLSSGESPQFTVRINRRYLEKRNFPKQAILSFYDQMKVKFPSKEEDAFIIHFSNSIMCYGCYQYDLYQVIECDYQKEELMSISYDSFYYWKKGEKAIYALPTPLAFSDRSTRINVYDATDYLK